MFTIVLFIIALYNISYAQTIYDCDNENPIRCISDIAHYDVCQDCKCRSGVIKCKNTNQIIFDTSDCSELRVDIAVSGDYWFARYNYELVNYYNNSIIYPQFSGSAMYADGFIQDRIDANKVVFTINITTTTNIPTIYMALTCIKYKNDNLFLIIFISVFVGIGFIIIVIVASILIWKYCCDNRNRNQNENNPYY
jgi:hypothetical protein